MKKQLNMIIMLTLFFLIFPEIEIRAKDYNISVNGEIVTSVLPKKTFCSYASAAVCFSRKAKTKEYVCHRFPFVFFNAFLFSILFAFKAKCLDLLVRFVSRQNERRQAFVKGAAVKKERLDYPLI